MAMGNQSLHIIGEVLGHKSPASTQIYARLASDPIRQAMEKAHSDMMLAAEVTSPDKSESAIADQSPKPKAPISIKVVVKKLGRNANMSVAKNDACQL